MEVLVKGPIVLIVMGLSYCVMISEAGAQAFRYQTQSASGGAQANAFSAQADDPSAIHYNPAGITQLRGLQWSGTVQFLGATVSYQNAVDQRTSGDTGNTIALPPPSQFYVTASLGDLGLRRLEGWTVGIGVTTPYALKSRYPENSPFSTAIISSAIPLIDIKPTIAYRFNRHLSVGLGADIYTFSNLIGEGHVEQKFAWPGGAGIPPGARVELNGDGTAAGFNVSVLYSPLLNADQLPIANLAFIYRSQAVLPLEGSMLVNGMTIADTRASITLPQTWIGAVAIWPIRDSRREWKVELDVEYVGWKSIRHTNVQLSTGGVIPQPQNWKTVPTISVGTEYKLLQPESMPNWEIALRGGYTYTLSQVPDVTFTPGIPSINSHTIGVGLGMTCSQGGYLFGVIPCGRSEASFWRPHRIGIDASFQAWIYEPRTIQGNINPTVNGTYTTSLYVGALGLRLAF